MLATKNPARVASILLMAASLPFLAGCMASGPRALLDGDAALQRGNYAAAVEKLKKATELLPDEPRAWNLLGLAYHKTGQRELAMQAYRRAMERDRNNRVSVAHFNLGCLLLESGNPAAAADELRSFTMISNSAPAWVKLGQAQLRQRQYDAAERSLANALRADPRNAEAYNDLGALYQYRGRGRDAAQYVNAALQVDPRNPPALLNSAIISHHTGIAKSAALKRYREFLAANPQSPNATAVSVVIRQLEAELAPPTAMPAPMAPSNNVAPAVTRTNAAAAPVQSNAAPLAIRPPAPASNGVAAAPAKANPPGAAAVTNAPAMTAVRPLNSATNASSARSAESTSVLAKAAPPPIAPRTNAPPREPPVTVASVPQQVAIRAATNPSTPVPPAEATTSGAAPSATPSIADSAAGQARKPGLLTRLNPFKDKTDGGSPAPTNSAATAARDVSAQRLAAAANPTRYAYGNPPAPAAGNRSAAQANFNHALAAAKSGRTNEALQQYEAALAVDPAYADAQYNYSLLLMNSGDLRRALPAWEKALAIEPDSLDTRYNFGLALRQAGFAQDAAAEFEKILEAKPSEARAHLLLGNLYSQQLNNVAKARDHYRKVLELEPRNSQAPAIRFWLAAHP